MRTLIILLIALAPASAAAAAQSTLGHPDGWSVHMTGKNSAALLSDLKSAIASEKMGLVTEAGPTEAAAQRGETIPGNRVLGVFRNDFAVTIIRAAPAAMIEAPIRFMIMEEPDGTATLAYKRPSAVFAPYEATGGETLARAASDLDTIFAAITEKAVGE
ncbi:DUF302 domain-containing protein [Acuticoccus sp. M5D2P5]|uniref:DUF302 domain-containing protein n=1 Tax=Acuticoccus kalidii TaxID=2910977 RepID=UPI001F2E8789|nr:DUF302 domain-containing protein [Acuticoccus kalidii]MCF3935414.1 DUF302 domain-containing protein [Acuticoccus kalidii]